MHSALQREKLTAANSTVPSSQLAFHAMQRRRFLENSALASLPLLSSLALLPGCAAYERNIHSDDRPSADAPAGRFRGVRQPDTGIQVYLGIPFMKNPYEPVRRFLAPQPMERIADTLDCVKHGALPLQPGPDGAMIGGDGPLCLNIWVPRDATPRSRFPVMVWVPGGGSIRCAQNDERFDGTHFAAHGCILVTLAYRVNIDGFLKIRGGDSNLGVRDIIMGLRWVKDNIAAFGGDPQAVTAFGQSAGGTHLVDVVASPYAQGLLHGAIIQSPSAVAQWRSDAQADRAAEFVAHGLGAEPTRDSLAKVPFEKLSDLPKIAGRLAADPEWAKFTDGNVSLFKGWIDQDFIPELPVDALQKGAARKMAFIVGSTSSEWRYYIVPNGAIAKKNRASAAALIAGANRPETALEAYARVNRGKTWGDFFAQIQSDLIFRMPCVKLAESLAAGGAQVWTYDFAWESPVKGKSGALLGAAHTVDVPFVFQNLSAPRAVRTIGERPPQALAQAMHSAWLTFAKTGSAPWTPFSLDTRRAMRFDAKSQEVSDPWAFERLTLPAR